MRVEPRGRSSALIRRDTRELPVCLPACKERRGHVNTQQEGNHLQPREKALTRNPPCRHPDLGLLASRTNSSLSLGLVKMGKHLNNGYCWGFGIRWTYLLPRPHAYPGHLDKGLLLIVWMDYSTAPQLLWNCFSVDLLPRFSKQTQAPSNCCRPLPEIFSLIVLGLV